MAVHKSFKRLLQDFLLAGALTEQDDEFRRRAMVLNASGLILMLMGLIWSLDYLINDQVVCGLLVVALDAGMFFFLWFFQRTGRLGPAANGILALVLGSMVIFNYNTGGLAGANAVVFVFPPVLAIFLLGSWGALWGLASLLCLAAFQVMDAAGFKFPQFIVPEHQVSDMTLTWFTSLVAVVGVCLLYERSRLQAIHHMRIARDQAEKASEAKTRFLQNVSHEFRTPMNAIIGMADLLLKTPLSESQQRKVELIQRGALSLMHLVNDVMDTSCMESGQFKLNLAPFSPVQLVEEVVSNMSVRADAAALQLRVETDAALPLVLIGDSDRIRRIVVNLLDNAIKYTEQGGVTIQVQSAESGGLIVRVIDTGVGIPADQTELIFESFRQARPDATPARGFGLGLSVCRQLVARMGGRIGVQSRVGGGSCFEVWLPLEAAPPGAEERPNRSHTIRILAADDDAVGRELVITILENAGFEVDVRNDGRQALDAFLNGTYDLVIMDVSMPGMDGLEAVRRIRANEEEGKRIPILALTAYALPEERDRCFEAGMDDFIAKPIHSEVLVGAIRRWVG